MQKLIPVVCLLLAACAPSKKSGLNRQELGLAEAYLTVIRLQQQIAPGNPAYPDSLDARLARMGFAKEQFETAVQSLKTHPERWEVFYEYLLSRIEQEENPSEKTPPGIKDFSQ